MRLWVPEKGQRTVCGDAVFADAGAKRLGSRAQGTQE